MSDTSDENIQDILLDEPMYYILTQFLETKNGKNIATVMEELTAELKSLRVTISAALSATLSSGSIPISVNLPPAQVSTSAAPGSQ